MHSIAEDRNLCKNQNINNKKLLNINIEEIYINIKDDDLFKEKVDQKNLKLKKEEGFPNI